MLIIFSVITLYTLIWTTNEFERQEQLRDAPLPPGAVPFWSALDHQNIYDLYAPSASKEPKQSSNITRQRIEELFQLIRNARTDQTHSVSIKKLYPIDPGWNFQKLIDERVAREKEDENKKDSDAHDEANDSNTNSTKTTPINSLPDLTTIEKTVNEYDKIQLRHYIHQLLHKWKKEHENDKIVTIADLMHDEILQEEPSRLNTSWYACMTKATNLRVYDPHSMELKRLLNHLQNGEVIEASEMSQGTQIKIILDLPDGFEALFKPYRVPRNYQTLPDHFYFSDVERHHAEIAAFHVDRILGFYRVPPVIGRLVDITRDIRETATEELAKTFFTSPANNTCFRGHCSYYCDTSHAVCGKPGNRLEGSVQVLLPRPPEIDWDKITHPYRRSYSAVRKAKWESDENYCYDHVFLDEEFHSRLLLDMMDLSAYDFLIGNMDRHHMMRIGSFGANTALIHLDNGRSFGRYDHDELTILAPIRQCCLFRYSTFARLHRVYRQGLSTLVTRSLENGEKLQKILIDEHVAALDRRLEILFDHLHVCIKTHTVKGVMVDDGID
ncbi:unnamed protein product [Rotaria socialis]|uniref:FAM20 C-terminal domain-containing protein n=1 Tax=Rotaria socialis TaxID=392032 RepID=A0A817X0H9_9BILA|nr:unnamed protein product [Rotaria socialis]CAF3377737.1 unnamed protein product [Rotaria socialis]CAF3688079.1 unnamed protein product [Rotaria socialis]CAF3759017.1 unnamed protein product [Rotaria socialis]CAF4391921.1 unnamed protein product [Rotaria socialis]